jgi:outer membrane protein
MRRKIIFTISIWLLSVWAVAQVSHDSLSLGDAIETALDNSFSLKISKNNQTIAENNVTRGNAGFLPTIDLTATHNGALINGEQIRGADSETLTDRRNKSTVIGAGLNWMIFDGRQMFLNYDRLQQVREVADADLRYDIERLLYNISSTFYQAAQEEERLNLLQKNLELSEERLNIARDKYELGRSSKVELLQAQVDFNADKSTILSQVEILASRKFQLLQLMGVSDTVAFNLRYDLELLGDISLNNLLRNIEDQNSLLISFRRLEEIALLEKRLFQAQRLPMLEVFTGYNYSEAQRAVGFSFESNTTEFAYGFTARWRLFNGFNLNRQIQNATIEAENAHLAYNEQKLALTTQLKTVFIRYQNNLQLMELEEENLDVAEENLEIAQERYRIGLSNALELREAQINFLNAEIRYQNAAFAAKIAETELIFLSGSMVQDIN